MHPSVELIGRLDMKNDGTASFIWDIGQLAKERGATDVQALLDRKLKQYTVKRSVRHSSDSSGPSASSLGSFVWDRRSYFERVLERPNDHGRVGARALPWWSIRAAEKIAALLPTGLIWASGFADISDIGLRSRSHAASTSICLATSSDSGAIRASPSERQDRGEEHVANRSAPSIHSACFGREPSFRPGRSGIAPRP